MNKKGSLGLLTALAALSIISKNKEDDFFGPVKKKEPYTPELSDRESGMSQIVKHILRPKQQFDTNSIDPKLPGAPMPSNFKKWYINGKEVWAATKKAAIKKANRA